MSGRVKDVPAEFRERVRLQGHIIDSLILPKVLDIILREGGGYRIEDIDIGRERRDPSRAELDVTAPTRAKLDELLGKLTPHGVVPVHAEDVKLETADLAGCFPEGFYSTTNLRTQIRLAGHWIDVDEQEMDCGVAVDEAAGVARCVPMHQVKVGERYVVGHGGVRVEPLARDERASDSFQFMTSAVSSEKPKGVTVRDIARQLRQTRTEGKKVLLVGGPAIVHTGAVEHVVAMIRMDCVHVVFAGNALATHDIEQAFYRTSLGVHMDRGIPAEEGHEHHLRSINRIRRLGGIRAAVEQGVLRAGIMHELIRREIPFVLAGSIRDDGPLPEVISDSLLAIDRMRELREGVGFCLMIATTLHSIATGNILPASIHTACVDISAATVTKLADRGTAHSVGIVTDVEPFLRALVQELERLGPAPN
jgi:lysine-ketoglutarate reductase/saccharopine dehydrogenase-like protein (TIGR00300 family)